jgi:hypothetical protein
MADAEDIQLDRSLSRQRNDLAGVPEGGVPEGGRARGRPVSGVRALGPGRSDVSHYYITLGLEPAAPII